MKIVNDVLSQSLTRSDALSSLEDLKAAAVKEAYEGEGGKVERQRGREAVYKEFDAAKEELEKIPALTLVLPAALPRPNLKTILKKARQLVGESVLLDIREDPAVLAGCQIVWKGKMKDYSLQAVLEEKRGEIKRELGSWVTQNIK